MKKQLFSIIALLCLAALFCISSYATDGAALELAPSVAEQTFSQGHDCVFNYTMEGMTVISTNGPGSSEGAKGDVYASYTVAQPFDGDKYQWIKLRIRNRSDAEVFEFHFASDGNGGSISADSCTHFPITKNDTDYKEYIFNIPEYNMESQNVNEDVKLDASVWSGSISGLRFDFMWVAEPSGMVPTGSEMDIQYIGFFDSEESAKAHQFKPAVSADVVTDYDDSYVWIFDKAGSESEIVPGQLDMMVELGALRIIPTGGDPTLTFGMPSDGPDTSEYKYLAFRLKTQSTVDEGVVFVSTEKNPQFASGGYTTFGLVNDGEWQKIIIDMQNNNAFWAQGGKLTGIRLDPINALDLDALVYLERVGIFKTIEEANGFLSPEVDEYGATTFFGKAHKAIVPSGVLSEGYDEKQYMLSVDEALVGEDGSLPVVYYTDASGNSSVVPLSYTNPVGYTTYMANKPGTYTVAFNKKVYSDIDDHWGASYINFVSERTLFGGTSETEFSPDMPMTRGMFATVLGRMHGLDTSEYDGNTGYTDVSSGEYYAPYIQWTKDIGIFAPITATEFEPESPITREAMAVVIAKYVEYYGYDFVSNAEPIEFTDISALTVDSIKAINAAQKAGIINGKGDGIFDPTGISTRAEVAAVMQRVIKGILGIKTYTSPYTDDYFHRDRIRVGVWNFNANVFGDDKHFKDLADLGADFIVSSQGSANPSTGETYLSLADKYGIETLVMFKDNYYNDPNTEDDKFVYADDVNYLAETANYYEHPSFGGNHMTDEPGMLDYERLADLCNKYVEQLPGKIPFVNLLPYYANDSQLQYGANISKVDYFDNSGDIYTRYCDQFNEMFNVDYICTDIYPLNWAGQTKTTYKDYIESINLIARSARKYDREFWCCIQTFGWTFDKRNPTEQEFRWQSYSMLSFGCTGILLWTYWSGNETYPAVVTDPDLEPSDNYYAAQPVMWELRRLSDTFIKYKNLGAFTHNCTDATPYLKMTDEYKDFDIIRNIDCKDPLLVGCFEAKEGDGYAFTLVNMVDFKLASGATVKFTLSQTDKTVTVYGKDDPKVLTPVDGQYTVDLEEGQGVFVTVE